MPVTLPTPDTLDALNTCEPAAFVAAIGEVFEHAPWVAAAVAGLHHGLVQAVADKSEDERVALFCGHPELAGEAARSQRMTADSQQEQGTLGLAELDGDSAAQWDELNRRYRDRFGFPFILCIKRHTLASALHVFAQRLAHDRADELEATLQEIGRITRLRLAQRIRDHALPELHGQLTTHVLDIGRGQPAEGLHIELFEVARDGRAAPGAPALARFVTDRHGSSERPLLHGQPLRIGRYEMRFHVGDYFRAQGLAQDPWPYLDIVPVVFAIQQSEADYHVPLTITPWAYGTYRGQ